LVTILGDLATAIVLIVTIRVRFRPSRMVLVAGYGGSAAILAALLLGQSYASGTDSVLHAPPGFAGWLFFAWHIAAGFFGLTYAWVRRIETGPPLFTQATMLAFTGVLATAVLATIIGGSWYAGLQGAKPLPGAGFAVELLAGTAIFAVWNAGAARIDRAFSITLLAMGLAFALETFMGPAGSVTDYAAALLYTIGATFVFSVAIRDFVNAFYRLDRTEAALVEHTQRLSAIWQIAVDTTIDEATRFQAMLDVGATAIRPRQPFYGHVARLDGDHVVIEASVKEHSLPTELGDLAEAVSPGTRFPLRDGLHADLLSARTTRDWSDLLGDPTLARRRRPRALGIRSAIGTTIRVGPVQYFVLFVSREPVQRPFTRDDHVFIDVLASFFTARLHQRRQLDHIRYQSEVDALTGVFNRPTFRSAATRVLSENGTSKSSALAIIDLDRFRDINDTYGHLVGDAVLRGVAQVLHETLAPGDVVGRLGGDTFGIMLGDVEGYDDAAERLRTVAEAISLPIAAGPQGETVQLHATCGVALAPGDARTFEALLSCSDAALASAKRGAGGIALYSHDIESSLEARRAMRRSLSHGIGARELVVHYQPSIALADGRPVGAEALVRWRHPTRGLIGPDDFIPFAEEHGLVGHIGGWVMRQVASDIEALGNAGDGLRIFVNLSLHQLDDMSFVTQLRELMRSTPELAQRLGFEITESAAMRDAGQTLRSLAIVRDLGIPVALDDFGTGYSSLAHLKRLPVDAIKIDRSFVAGLPGDVHDAALVETQLSIARQFGYETHAEGVEREDQRAWLRARGCKFAQGFLIARPMPVDDFRAWLGASDPSRRAQPLEA
jgi:diguanylate cyclase (GGDEF)-like protein